MDSLEPRRRLVPLPSAATVVVWLAWLACAAALWGMTGRFVGKSPHLDDVAYFGLNLLPANAHASDLWIPLNEHRVPLPKFATWALMRVGGYDPRAAMRAGVLLVAAGAAALLAALRRARGRTEFADALVPLTLLSPGQAENFLWAVQINFTLPAALLAGATALFVSAGPAVGAGRAGLLGLAAVLLALCGIQGQIPAALLACWLLGFALLGRGAGGWAACPLAGVLGLVALGLAALCVVSAARPVNVPGPEYSRRAARYVVRVLGSAFGPVSESVGPAEPDPLPALLGVAALAVVAGALLFLWRGLRAATTRPAAAGLLALLAGAVATVAGVGLARGPLNGWVLAGRYVTLAAPLLTVGYCAATRFGGRTGRAFCAALALVTLALAWPNAEAGLDYARTRRDRQRLIESGARRGVPPSFFVDHHGGNVFPPKPSELGVVFEALRAMRIAPYHLIAPEPKLREVPAPWSVESFPGPDAAGWRGAGPGDRVRGALVLEPPPGARGVRIDYSARGVPGRTTSELWWPAPMAEGTEPAGRRAVRDFFEPGEGRSKRLWLGSPVGRVEFALDGPAAVRIERVVALADADP